MGCNCSQPKNTNPCRGCVNCSERCHVVVTSRSEVSEFRNAFVTVQDENATYHVDDVGNVIAVSRNPIFDNDYQPTAGDWKNTVVYNFLAEEGYVFNNDGDYMIIPLIDPEQIGGSS